MDSQRVDLKRTLNLMRTDFPMKANLPQSEPKMLERWQKEDIYGQIRRARQGRPAYVLHDGPPYANGEIHLGTAFNKILKDFVIKSKCMAGFDTPYVPGWDCHGLPIEIKVESELGSRKARMTAGEIRAACRRYAQKYLDIQRQQFIRLGIFGRWEDPYLTMSPQYEAAIARAFVEFLVRGYVYKGLKPVHWCLKDRTALAEAEVEYENHTSPSIWVLFKLDSPPDMLHPALAGRKVYAVVWTTTPWTIPANMVLAFNPKFDYVAVQVGSEVYIVATDLLDATAQKCGWQAYKVLVQLAGMQFFQGPWFRHPFADRNSPAIVAEHVTLEQGTGIVHTAPGHGHEDYEVGLQNQIEIYCPVDESGRFYNAPVTHGKLPEELIGKTVWEANPIVIDLLQSRGALLAQEKIEHSYPHCWRCHNPTIFRATEQWFIGMERNQLRQNVLSAIKAVHWMPEWGQERMANMIATRPDWCISRQRVWGVPIIVFYCGQCREPLTDRGILDGIVDLFEKHTADVWYERTASELLPDGIKCPKCGATEFAKESDILDVWFDSGSSHLAVLTKQNGLEWPADLYLEGGDQHRGWFHSSLLVGVGLKGAAPYRTSATNGWALDGEGRAMHKSLGNDVPPHEIIEKHGAEVLRLWTASVDFYEDVRMSDEILARLTEAYRKLRNTFRYPLGNLSDFDPQRDAVPAGKLPEIDQWILLRAEDLVARCRVSYDEFAFHKVYRALYDFATVDLSAVYFDVLKDRLYTHAPRSHSRRSAQTVLHRLLYALVRLCAPILAFTTEEVWKHMGLTGSVHTALFPDPAELVAGIPGEQRKRAENWDRLMDVRKDVLKSLEVARQEKFIGAPLEARVRLSANSDLYPLLEKYAADLPALFIVSQVELERAPGDAVQVRVERALGTKCERCWKYTTDVGSNPEFPTICAACAGVVEEVRHE